MPQFPFLHIDAFANQPFQGNPCAIVLDSDGLRDETFLKIAREFNLAETAFVGNSTIADFAVRFFTPAEEIPLAGHPTIATVFALVDTDRIRLEGTTTTITLELTAGVIVVEIHADQHKPLRIVMTQLKPRFMRVYEPSEVLPSFGLSEDDVLPNAPIQTVSTGTAQLIVPLNSPQALRKACLNIPRYELFRETSDFFSPHLFCLTGATARGQTFARHFGTPPDLPEDAFTGSATGGMAAYLWRYNLIERPTFIAEQGHWMNRPGEASVEIVGSRDDIATVRIGGSAVPVMRGQLLLENL